MKNLSVENVYTRAAAKELTKKHLGKLLGMTAVAFGIPYAMMLAVTTLLTPLAETQPTLYLILDLVLTLAVTLATCGLTLGLLAALVNLCRGNENLSVGMVFSHMGCTLKAFGLSLWTGLKTFLWMLPGFAVMMAGVIVSAGTSSPEDSAGIMTLLTFCGIILMLALVIPAAYRYMMSTYILADKPETGVFQSVRESKAMMKGHKWQCFKLIIPIVLVMYVIMLVIGVAMGAAMSLLATTPAAMTVLGIVMMIVMLIVMLYYMIRMYLCYAIFYVKRVEEQNPAEETADAAYAE